LSGHYLARSTPRCPCVSVVKSQGTMTSWSSSSVGVCVTSSSNNDVISGESSTTDMAAAGATGGNEGLSVAPPSGGGGRRGFRLLPSLHSVLFAGRGRQRAPSTGRQSNRPTVSTPQTGKQYSTTNV